MQKEEFLQEISHKKIDIFGTGYVARIFLRALEEQGLSDRVRAFVVSGEAGGAGKVSQSEKMFCGKPVFSAAEYQRSAGM